MHISMHFFERYVGKKNQNHNYLHVKYMSYLQPVARVLTYRNSENILLFAFFLFCFVLFIITSKFSMGINHDNDHPSCADGVHIMSGEWIKGQNLGDVSWSQCSREDLERFLRYIIEEKSSYCMSLRNRCN